MNCIDFVVDVLNKTVADAHKTCAALSITTADSVDPCRCEYQPGYESDAWRFPLQILLPFKKTTWSRRNIVSRNEKLQCPGSCCLSHTGCFIRHASNACCFKLWETLDVISSSTCTNHTLLCWTCLANTQNGQAWRLACSHLNVQNPAEWHNKTCSTICSSNAHFMLYGGIHLK